MKMHLQTDLSCEISYKNCEEKVQISQEAEMLYYELIRALEEEETYRIDSEIKYFDSAVTVDNEHFVSNPVS
ncbi:hypothetical protein SFRURICE_010664 [Spodoptera frugiperda]|uniref:SFRICE_033011 n=1 Tax=Spodoptera frugiperda TaxID=7108 RepID=A0A2H1VQZ9_SPOFR|nr:hypothetical protein SFRURICE_010664 [Spodoptera frugiperda]